ncbi:hypothetical protein PLICRDRAFT_317259 [Plicaturopsis crispa FD-325 SS-3]|nr:hypothetical protein PLICRDRAFT_317259 [Plicaturopsis crispa FD-325 SS-3]
MLPIPMISQGKRNTLRQFVPPITRHASSSRPFRTLSIILRARSDSPSPPGLTTRGPATFRCARRLSISARMRASRDGGGVSSVNAGTPSLRTRLGPNAVATVSPTKPSVRFQAGGVHGCGVEGADGEAHSESPGLSNVALESEGRALRRRGVSASCAPEMPAIRLLMSVFSPVTSDSSSVVSSSWSVRGG